MFEASQQNTTRSTQHCTFGSSQKYLLRPQDQAKQQLKKSSETWESSAGKLGDLQNQIKSSGVGGGGGDAYRTFIMQSITAILEQLVECER